MQTVNFFVDAKVVKVYTLEINLFFLIIIDVLHVFRNM